MFHLQALEKLIKKANVTFFPFSYFPLLLSPPPLPLQATFSPLFQLPFSSLKSQIRKFTSDLDRFYMSTLTTFYISTNLDN